MNPGRWARRLAFRRTWLAALLTFAIFGSGVAANWTIQTVALRDLRDAQATAEDLRHFGLDAYTEFAMWEGEQFVRVRFGCFTTQHAADEMAIRVRTSFVADAVSVARTPGAPTKGCLEETTGFLKPAQWRQRIEGGSAFDISMAETTAVVLHNGRRWRIFQAGEALPELAPPSTPRFSQALLGDVPVVQLEHRTQSGGAGVVLCPGRLLGEIGDVAIVDRGDRIVACRMLDAEPVGGAS